MLPDIIEGGEDISSGDYSSGLSPAHGKIHATFGLLGKPAYYRPLEQTFGHTCLQPWTPLSTIKDTAPPGVMRSLPVSSLRSSLKSKLHK